MKNIPKYVWLTGIALLVLVAGYFAYNKYRKSSSTKKVAAIGANFTMQDETVAANDTKETESKPVTTPVSTPVIAPVASTVA